MPLPWSITHSARTLISGVKAGAVHCGEAVVAVAVRASPGAAMVHVTEPLGPMPVTVTATSSEPAMKRVGWAPTTAPSAPSSSAIALDAPTGCDTGTALGLR